jgi:hypothetical protein
MHRLTSIKFQNIPESKEDSEDESRWRFLILPPLLGAVCCDVPAAKEPARE